MTGEWNPVHGQVGKEEVPAESLKAHTCPTCGADVLNETDHRYFDTLFSGWQVRLVACPSTHELKMLRRC